MSGPALALAWGLSFSLLALDAVLSAQGAALVWPGASRLGLALLPWLALAGLPPAVELAAGDRPTGGSLRAALVPVALALPLVAMGLGLDVASVTILGGESVTARLFPYAAPAAFALALVFIWSCAAECARASRSARRIQGSAWLLLVPGLATVRCALVWAPRGGGGELEGGGAWAVSLATLASPCVWVFDWMRALERFGTPPGLRGGAVVLLGVACLVWAATSVAARGSRSESEGAQR